MKVCAHLAVTLTGFICTNIVLKEQNIQITQVNIVDDKSRIRALSTDCAECKKKKKRLKANQNECNKYSKHFRNKTTNKLNKYLFRNDCDSWSANCKAETRKVRPHQVYAHPHGNAALQTSTWFQAKTEAADHDAGTWVYSIYACIISHNQNTHFVR